MLLGMNHGVSLHFCEFTEAFRIFKIEEEEQFGTKIYYILPLFQGHTQLTMARNFNDASIQGTTARLQWVCGHHQAEAVATAPASTM
jgi:hypothetical protein